MSDDAATDALCREFFQLQVEKEKAKVLKPEEKKVGKGSTVRKVLQAIGEDKMVSVTDASVMSKHQDPKTKTVTDEVFVKNMLPHIAKEKTKCKSEEDEKVKTEVAKMKKKMCDKLEESKKSKGPKNAAVVDRLTDTTKYTGSHGARFDASGKGKGKEGREEQVDSSGYVGNYKGAGTFDAKK